MAQINYRTLNIDAYDPDSSLNFPLSTLLPSSLPPPSTAAESSSIAQSTRQLLRSGDAAGALSSVLETAPLGGDDAAKAVHLATVLEVLQGIRQSEVSRVLEGVLGGEGGSARGDALMKYLYKGMAGEQSKGRDGRMTPQGTGTGGFSQIQARNVSEGSGGGQAMSVLLSWHEKLVEVVGVGGIVRVMCDRRTV